MSDDPVARLPRRTLLKSLAVAALWEPACSAFAREDANLHSHGIEPGAGEDNPIRVENRLPGSDSLALQCPALAREVEGYASVTSATAGDDVEICVSVSRAQGVHWDLYRIGHYQGLGARLVTSGDVSTVSPQAQPNPDSNTGLLECAWQAAFVVTIDPSWVTGYYLLKLTNDDGFDSYVPLIVREAEPRAPLLAQASVTTWQAYNRWGDVSLYVNHLPKDDPAPFLGPRGYRVSFDRPYAADADIGSVEHAMVRWLEQKGYDVAYVTNVDIDAAPELLAARRLFMSIGHDEYWSLAERNAVQDARDRGLSLAFFSGNPAFRRIRLEPSAAGVERRVITCYKSGTLDPRRNAPDTTAEYHDAPFARPENELLGVVWAGWANLEGFPFVVTNPDHWLYHGTGVKAGDTLGQIVGYEWDCTSDNGHAPPGLEVVAESPVVHEYGYTSLAQATVYYPTDSSLVFAAGTVGWAKGLSEPGIVEPRVQRVTENVLLHAGLLPETRTVVLAASSAPIASNRARLIAGTGSPGRQDGLATSAQFASPAAVAAGPNGELYVCDTGNGLIRLISSDGLVSTLLGAPGSSFQLASPTGIAVDARGRVFISDSGNHRILVIGEDGRAETYAGRSHVQGLIDAPSYSDARFNQPRGLVLAGDGSVYVADFRNDAIRRLDASGVTTVVSAAGGPSAVAVAPDGTLYYVATWLGAIVQVSPDGVRRVLANSAATFGDRIGPGAQAALRPADGLVLTDSGLIFSDTANNRLRTLAFDEENSVSNLLGSGRGGSRVVDGTELCLPRGLASVGEGYVVVDSQNHRVLAFGSATDATPTVDGSDSP